MTHRSGQCLLSLLPPREEPALTSLSTRKQYRFAHFPESVHCDCVHVCIKTPASTLAGVAQ